MTEKDWKLGWVGPREVVHRGEVHLHMVVGPVPMDYDGEFYFYDSKRPLEKDCLSGQCLSGGTADALA